MREKLLLIGLGLICLVVVSDCQFQDMINKMSSWGDKMKGQGGDFMDEMKDKFNKLPKKVKEKMMEKRKAVLDKLPEQFRSGNFENMTSEELLTKLQNDDFAANAIDPRSFASMKQEERQKLLDSSKVPNKVKEQIRMINARQMQPQDAINELKKASGQGNRGMNRELVRSLGDPKDWTLKNITHLQEVIFRVPSQQLLKIKDSDAARQVFTLMKNCFKNTSPTGSCPMIMEGNKPKKSAIGVLRKMMEKGYGDLSKLSKENLRQVEPQFMSGEQVKKLIPSIVKDELTTFKDIEMRYFMKPGLGDAVLNKLIDADKVKSMKTAEEVESAILDYGGVLQGYLKRDMIPDLDYSKTEIAKIFNDNKKNRLMRGVPTREDMRDFVKSTMNLDLSSTSVTLPEDFGIVAPASRMREAIKNGKMKSSDIRDAIEKDMSPAGRAKVRKFAKDYFNSVKGSNGKLTADDIPEKMASQVPAADLGAMTSDDKKRLSRMRTRFTNAQKSALLKDGTVTGLKDYGPDIKASVSIEQIKSAGTSDLKDFVSDVSPSAPVSSFAMEKNIGSKIQASNIDQVTSRHLGSVDVDKIDVDSITDVLEKIAATGDEPMQSTCRALKNKLGEKYKKDADTESDLDMTLAMDTSDVESTPLCVIAELGSSNIKRMTGSQKNVLFDKLTTSMDNSKLSTSARRTIVEEGLKENGKTKGGFTVEELDLLGNAVMDAPTSMIRDTVDRDALELLISTTNSEAMKVTRPCMSKTQISSVRTIVKRFLGDLSQVDGDKIQPVCCLLDTLSLSEMSRIPTDAITACNCEKDKGEPRIAEMKEATCRSETDGVSTMMMGEENLRTVQSRATMKLYEDALKTSRRRKRQASSGELSDCDMAQFQGPNAFSTSRLRDVDDDEMMECLDDFTQIRPTSDRCKIIKDKVKGKTNNLKDATPATLMRLGNVLTCVEEDEVEDFPALSDLAVIESLGMVMDVDDDVRAGLAKKVKTDYKQPNSLTVEDIHGLGMINGGFTKEDINGLTSDTFRGGIGTLSSLKDCEDEQLEAMASKAKSVYGAVSTWTKSTVSELGTIVAGLSPEDMPNLNNAAISGMTVGAIKDMPADVIKTMKIDQLQSLPQAAALSVSSEQKKGMNSEMRKFLSSLEGDDGNGVSGVALTSLTTIVAAIFLTRLL